MAWLVPHSNKRGGGSAGVDRNRGATPTLRGERQKRPQSNAGRDRCCALEALQRRAAGCRGLERQLRGPAHGLACGRSPLGNRRSSKLIAVVREGGQGNRPGPNL